MKILFVLLAIVAFNACTTAPVCTGNDNDPVSCNDSARHMNSRR